MIDMKKYVPRYSYSEGGEVFYCPIKVRSLDKCMKCKYFSAYVKHNLSRHDAASIRCLYDFDLVDDIFLDDLLSLLHQRFD